MQDPNNLNKVEKNINLDEEGIKQILETRKWTMFLSLLSFIAIGLALIFIMVSMTTTGGLLPAGARWTFVPGIIFLLVYLIPFYYLYKFSVISKEAITINGIYKLSDALLYLKKHYRFLGIVAIVFIALYLIILLIIFISVTYGNL
ncbi:MAG: hypothetical protein K9H49_07425 [Bacteroidales bacterium]|nr:hypothetical protein [Bacteroidales bacterium]MCF8390342.1 hypothetical protein [Bacteroidales bacterium]